MQSKDLTLSCKRLMPDRSSSSTYLELSPHKSFKTFGCCEGYVRLCKKELKHCSVFIGFKAWVSVVFLVFISIEMQDSLDKIFILFSYLYLSLIFYTTTHFVRILRKRKTDGYKLCYCEGKCAGCRFIRSQFINEQRVFFNFLFFV